MAKLSKRWKVGLVSAASLILMVAMVPLAIWVTHTSSAQVGNEQARCTRAMPPVHTVVIRGSKVSPLHTEAKVCDTLTIVNDDNQTRVMAFGPHSHHISYDGVSEKLLSQGQSLSVKLVSTGNYIFHDHENEAVHGSFTVSK